MLLGQYKVHIVQKRFKNKEIHSSLGQFPSLSVNGLGDVKIAAFQISIGAQNLIDKLRLLNLPTNNSKNGFKFIAQDLSLR